MKEIGITRPNEALEATAAAPVVFDGVGNSLLPPFVRPESPAAVLEFTVRRLSCEYWH